MSKFKEELKESMDRDIIEGYIAFYEIEKQYDNINNQINISNQEVKDVLSILETEIERRNQEINLEHSKELLEGKKEELNYDPTKRTKWLVSRGLYNKKQDEDFTDYWKVYTNFLETFRNPKTDLTQYK